MKIIKLMLIFFCFFISNANALNDMAATQELTRMFYGREPINIMLVTRNSFPYQYNNLDLDELALIFACLAVNLHPERVVIIRGRLQDKLNSLIYNPILPNISRYLSNPNYQQIVNIRKQGIIAEFNRYANLHNILVQDNRWKIIIFNEAFFSKNTPLTLQEVQEIKDLFFYFLRGFDERTLLYANFLYMNNEVITAYQRNLLVLRTLTPTVTAVQRMAFTNNVFNNIIYVFNYLQRLMGINNFVVPQPMLYNRSTMSYYDLGHVVDMTHYDKASYCSQLDQLILLWGGIYYIGDGRDHIFPGNTFPHLSNLLIENVSSEICYDLACGVRRANGWINGNGLARTRLHIFVSNTFLVNPWMLNNMFSPLDTIVACADPHGIRRQQIGMMGGALTDVFKRNVNAIYPLQLSNFNCGNNQYNITTARDIITNDFIPLGN